MDAVRQTLRWSVPGGVTILSTMALTSLPDMVQRFGHGSTPMPRLSTITTAEVALMAFAALFLGFIVYQIAHFLPALVVYSGIVRFDLSGAILRHADVYSHAHRFDPGYPDHDTLSASLVPLIQVINGPFQVYRLDQRTKGYSSAEQRITQPETSRELRRTWRSQLGRNRGLLAALMLHLTTELGVKLKIEYDGLTDLYRGLGATRVGVLLSGLISLVRILGYPGGRTLGVRLASAAICSGVVTAGLVVLSRQRGALLQRRHELLVTILPRALRAETNKDHDQKRLNSIRRPKTRRTGSE